MIALNTIVQGDVFWWDNNMLLNQINRSNLQHGYSSIHSHNNIRAYSGNPSHELDYNQPVYALPFYMSQIELTLGWQKRVNNYGYRICLNCKKVFKPQRNRHRFCSISCGGGRKRILPDYECPVCGIMFRPESKKIRHCSIKCAKQNLPKKGIIRECGYCSKELYVQQSEIKKINYCSKICSHRSKIREKVKLNCEFCGIIFYEHKGYLKSRGRKYCSIKCRGLNARTMTGEKSPTWQGGKSSINHRLRAGITWKEWRTKIFERDNYTCQDCGIRGGVLEPHHLNRFAYFPELRFIIENGITLCVGCHNKTKKYDRDKTIYLNATIQNKTICA